MSIELTEQQLQVLAQEPELAPRVVNPRTNETYVLLRAEVYERAKVLLDEIDDLQQVRDMYPHIWAIMKEDWEDPAMNVYDHYPRAPEKP